MRKFKLFDEVYIKSKHKRGQIVDLVTDNNGRDGYLVEDDNRDENGDFQIEGYHEEDLEKV
jgi:hypothetical protein